MDYIIGDTSVNWVSSFMDLGTLFNNNFTFHDHLDFVYKKVVRTGEVHQTKDFWLQAKPVQLFTCTKRLFFHCLAAAPPFGRLINTPIHSQIRRDSTQVSQGNLPLILEHLRPLLTMIIPTYMAAFDYLQFTKSTFKSMSWLLLN